MELLKSLLEQNYQSPYDKYSTEELNQRHATLTQKKDKAEMVLKKAKEITKAIKYSQDVSNIIVSLSELAEQNHINTEDFNRAVNEVNEANNALESAVYGLEEVFQEVIRNLGHQLDIVEDALDERGAP